MTYIRSQIFLIVSSQLLKVKWTLPVPSHLTYDLYQCFTLIAEGQDTATLNVYGNVILSENDKNNEADEEFQIAVELF